MIRKYLLKAVATALVCTLALGGLAACGNEEFVFVPGEDYPDATPTVTVAPTKGAEDPGQKRNPEKLRLLLFVPTAAPVGGKLFRGGSAFDLIHVAALRLRFCI